MIRRREHYCQRFGELNERRFPRLRLPKHSWDRCGSSCSWRRWSDQLPTLQDLPRHGLFQHQHRGWCQLSCPDDTYILDAAEEAGVICPIPAGRRLFTCAGRLVSGSVDQTDQSFLDDDQIGQGFALLCVSYPPLIA